MYRDAKLKSAVYLKQLIHGIPHPNTHTHTHSDTATEKGKLGRLFSTSPR